MRSRMSSGRPDRPGALFDAHSSPEKTLHADPGDVPSFGVDDALRFFARHLT